MKSTRIGRLVIMVAALLLLGSAGGAPSAARAQVAQPPQGGRQTAAVIQATPADQQAALAQWTREARLAAKPMALPAPAAGQPAPQGEPQTLAGPSGSAPGGAPQASAQEQARQQFPEEWRLLDQAGAAPQLQPASQTPLGTAGVYTSYLGNYYSIMHTIAPYLAVGKLYIAGGGWCSASVISPNNIIVTAAHCVYNTDTNSWYGGWTFVPADRAGAAPFGVFPWAAAAVPPNWMAAPDSVTGRRYDVATIRLGNNGAGYPVTAYTGWLGRAWNYGYVQHLHAIGYPSNLYGSGSYTHICAAETFAQTTDVLGMGCNMMHGSSGGPWIMAFAPYGYGYVDSVVSGGLSGATWGNTFYGARFSNDNIVVVCTSLGC